MADLTVEDVCDWLGASDASFGAYVPLFRANHIDGSALGLLTREDLADIGVRSVGHRLAILQARADLHGTAATGDRATEGHGCGPMQTCEP
jgi:hypothetical protein